MSQIQVRINGRGNAWPVIVGQVHPFYNSQNIEDLANASCSVVYSHKENPKVNEIKWELMIDAGHGATQFLIKNSNRIPEALFLTHPHIDHILGIDWIIQSYYKTYKQKYPVYATKLCYERTLTSFPHLKEFIDFKELVPFKKSTVNEVNNVSVTPYPVYHGQSAVGAVMLLFNIENETKQSKVLFTGDILCPLLRKQDFNDLIDIDLIVADANNRFPYPKSNHWSVLKGIFNEESNLLNKFKDEITLGMLLYPHIHNSSVNYCKCFDYFFNQEIKIESLFFSIIGFIQKINPKAVALIHYSGDEDEKYYKENRLKQVDLEKWLLDTIRDNGIKSSFLVPYVGQHIKITNG